MRLTRLFLPTLREDPAEAEIPSHRLLVRAGMIRQLARGIYDILPLGLRVVRKVEQIIREEMDRAGAQELLLPTITPAELWIESGRWEHYGKELLRMKDRSDRDFCYGPTHEEVITELVRREVRSYRDLPLNLYQIQTKFRDELRPRFGLLRAREFIMKDAYSFHATREDCLREYRNMFATYEKIFQRCGLRYCAVEADTGTIGGNVSHEFQVLAENGEDSLLTCSSCDYAANRERAEAYLPDVSGQEGSAPLQSVSTPGLTSVEEVSEYLRIPPSRLIKTLLYQTSSGEIWAVLVRGDHEVNESKLRRAIGGGDVQLADDPAARNIAGVPLGFVGPVGLRTRMIADCALKGTRGAVAGANKPDHHVLGVEEGRDWSAERFLDLRMAMGGESCPRCQRGQLTERRGIEVGQIFYLGTKYSEPLKALFLDQAGRETPIEMGCYGIGVTRVISAAIEQNHDGNGIVWPSALAPYQVLILPVDSKVPKLAQVAEELYDHLLQCGIEVLVDDRLERPGIKFKDADLIGIPLKVTVGLRGIERGKVEVKFRNQREPLEIPISETPAWIIEKLERGE